MGASPGGDTAPGLGPVGVQVSPPLGLGPETTRTPLSGGQVLRRDSLILMTSTVAVGIGNYGFSLALIWVLPSRQFAVVAAISTLLVVVATAANSALPWVLAREVSRHAPHSVERRRAAGFTLVASVVGGLVAGGIVAALAYTYASPGELIAAAAATLAVFVVQVGSGYLQGASRFRALAVLAIVEVVIKAGLGVGLAAGGLGATGALAGAAVAAGFWAVTGLVYVGREIAAPTRSVAAALWRRAASIGGVQVGVIALSTLDVLIGSIRYRGIEGMGGYQAMLVFARVPLFISGAVSSVAYPRMAASNADARPAVRESLTIYLIACLAVVSVVMTIPARLIGAILPHHYSGYVSLLVPLAIAGMAAGQINVVTTFFQAEDRYRPTLAVLWPAVAAAAVALSLFGASISDLAWTSATANGAVALVLTAMAARRYGIAAVSVRAVASAAGVAALAAVLRSVRSDLPVWLILSAVLGLAAFAVYQRGYRSSRAGRRSVWMTAMSGLARNRLLRRRLLAATTRAITRMRPLVAPDAWEMILAARSAAGEGPLITTPRALRVLVIAPHPDDETIGCGGTAALMAGRGSDVTVVVVSSGEQSVASPAAAAEVGRARRDEATAACAVLGTRPPIFLGFPDGSMSRNVAPLSGRFDDVIAAERPQVIFAPWPLDAHDDHRAVAAALATASLPEDCEVWTYEVWAALPANRIVDVSSSYDLKVAALDCHRTGRETFDLDSHLALARWRSIFGLDGQGQAEAFLALSAEQFRRLARGLPATAS